MGTFKNYEKYGKGSSGPVTPLPKIIPDEIKAQDYLKGKMKTIANASEGVIPGGDAYKKYGKMPGEESSDSGGSTGDLRAAYKAKFGTEANDDLASAQDAASANAVYDKIKSLKSEDFWNQQDLGNLMTKAGHQENVVNIGNYTKDGGLAVDASIANGISFDSIQSQLDKKNWNGEKNNSIGQLGSALLAADGSEEAADPEPEKERTPIEHSPEINEAKERVRNYEDSVLSGQLSNDIYGKSNAMANDDFYKDTGLKLDSEYAGKSYDTSDSSYLDDYQFEVNKGGDGIGTAQSTNPTAQTATNSFLDSKKQDIKKQYKFTAKK